MKLKKAEFSLEGTEWFAGFSSGKTWNGWACPYFTLEQGKKVMAALNESDDVDPPRMGYFSHSDQFVVVHTSCEVETYKGIKNPVGGEKLYPIGAMGWCWYEREPGVA